MCAVRPDIDDAYLTDLALRAQAGDSAAVAQLVASTQRDVIRFVAYLGGAGDAEDLAQETIIRALKALPTFQARSSARTWLLAIARHTVLDHLRQRSRRPRSAAAEDWLAVADGVQATTGGRLDEQVLLQQLIAALEPQRREAFVATQLLGLSYEHAAQVFDCPVGTIRSRVARAREDLTQALAADDNGREHRHLRAL
jgi:RNA polymerase sigma-70 factor, ECF subfamily